MAGRAFSGMNACLAVVSILTVTDASVLGDVDAGSSVLSIFAVADCSESHLVALS